MKNIAIMSIILCLIYVLVAPNVYPEQKSSAADSSGKSKNTKQKPEVDEWRKGFDNIRNREQTLSNDLIATAKDTNRSIKLRRYAISLLGEMNINETRQFLIDNIFMHVPPDGLATEDTLAEYPCLHALRNGDWQTVHHILFAVKKKKSRNELVFLGATIRNIMNIKMAIAAIDDIIKQKVGKNDIWKKNLTHLKTFVMK